MKWRLLPILSVLLVAGCPGQKELLQIQDSIDEVQRQVYDIKRQNEQNAATLQQINTSLQSSLEDVRRSQASINQQIDTLGRDGRALTQKLDDVARQLETRRTAPAPYPGTATVPPPASGGGSSRSVYNDAYTDYSLGNWDLAIQGFGDYTKNYSPDDMTDNAQYWIGECYYSKGDYDNAMKAFDRLIQDYPGSDMRPAAHLKKGLILIGQDRLTLAVLELQHVIDNYPESPEAIKARERIREIGLAGR